MVESEAAKLKEEQQTALVDSGEPGGAHGESQDASQLSPVHALTAAQNEPQPGPSAPTRQLEVIEKHKQRLQRDMTLRFVQLAVIGVLLVTGAAYLWARVWFPARDNNNINPAYDQQPQYTYNPNPISTPAFQLPYLGTLSKVGWEKFQWLLMPACGLSAVALIGLLAYAGHTRRKYIEFDKIGILISDNRQRGEGNARFIPWGCLEAVETIYPQKQTRGVHDEGTAALSDAIMGADDPENCTVVFYVDDGSVLKMSWHDITSCCEPGTFINALKTWAPDIKQTCKFPGQVGKVDTTTYTQLWFKYYSTGSDRKRTSMLEKGDVLQDGRFEIAGQLGGGGQGTAYLAVDKQANAATPEVVLKEYILPVHRGQQVLEQTVEKLRAEATILSKIDHRNIVKMLGEFIEDHRGYLIMEYVAGRSLKSLVAAEGPQPEAFVVELALQICDMLEHLHGMSPPVVHRDLTPDNLILQDDGILKLVDFNVAHQLESQATATVVGKHCYIPPEQFRGKPTPRSDIYALGGSLYYLLTGDEPEPLTVSHPKKQNPAVSDEMDTIVAGCTTLDAARRFANVAELRSALESLRAAVSEKH